MWYTKNIGEKYGKEIKWNNQSYYTFPTPIELSKATIKDLRLLGLGFRDARVYETTKMVNEKQIDLKKLEKIEDINIYCNIKCNNKGVKYEYR